MVGKVSHVFPNPRRHPFYPGFLAQVRKRIASVDPFPASPPRAPRLSGWFAVILPIHRPTTARGRGERSTTYIGQQHVRKVISRLITVWDNLPATSTSTPALPDPCLPLFLAFIPPPAPFRDDAGHHPHRLPGQECHFYHERRLSPAQTHLVEGSPHLPDLPFLVLRLERRWSR